MAISETFTNNTDSYVRLSFDLFNNPFPEPFNHHAQTLNAGISFILAPHETATETLPVQAGKCYQIDSIIEAIGLSRDNLGTTNTGTANHTYLPGDPEQDSNFLAGAQFCVPAVDPAVVGLSPGYYKNHQDVVESLLSTLPDHKLYIGSSSNFGYTADQLHTILTNNPAGGDSRQILAFQLIAAELNILAGYQDHHVTDDLIPEGNLLLNGINLLSLSKDTAVKSDAMNNLASILSKGFNSR